MSYISNICLAVLFVLIISTCGGYPHQSFTEEALNNYTNDGATSDGIPHSPSLQNLKLEVEKSRNNNYRHRNEATDQTFPVPNFVQTVESDFAVTTLSPISRVQEDNPSIRVKRSEYKIPNLPEYVKELNQYLSSIQYIFLNPQHLLNTSNDNTEQANTCPNTTTDNWWSRDEDNLRSSCPWNITERYLGENAFPRYIKEAFSLSESCIGAPSMKCQAITQTVTHLYRLDCHNNLALLETRNVTIKVGYHCVTPVIRGNAPETP